MPEKLSSQQNMVLGGIAAFLLVLAGGYFMFFANNETGGEEVKLDSSYFGKDVKAYYDAKGTIDFKQKNLEFTKKAFYTNSVDYTVEISPVNPTGRANPFVPYVTP